MRQFRGLCAVAFLASAAVSLGQIQLNVSVETKTNDGSAGSNSINVSAGDPVEYQVRATLSPGTGHMGLALVGFNLSYSGGDLAQASAPATPPDGTCATAMGNFVKNWGITNPAGYGGTVINGDLIQVGGGQNTIKNIDSADFPIGAVRTGVAQPVANDGCGSAILATGSLSIPVVAAAGQAFTLTPNELFANVIAPGQTGTEEFWATIAASAGTLTPLTMTTTAPGANFVSSFPVGDTQLWRTNKNRVRITFSGTVSAPGPGDIQIRKLLDGGLFESDVSGSFTASVNGADLVLTDNAATLLNHTWYRVSNPGTWGGVNAFDIDFLVQAGDANNDGFVNFADLGTINTWVPTTPAQLNETNMRGDVSGDKIINFGDMAAANAFIVSTPVAKPTGH